MTEPTEFLPGIFVGDKFIASDENFFKENNIVRVVNCTSTLPFSFPSRAQYFRIPIEDSSDEINNNLMAAYLIPAIKFVMEVQPRKGRGVLIHCQAGISRSCTVAVGVLRACCCSTIKQAMETLMMKRDIAFFRGMYVNFEKALYRVFPEQTTERPEQSNLSIDSNSSLIYR